MIEAIIFDMDGLLVDSEPVWDKARSILAAEAGKSWNADDHKAVMGVSTHEWVAYMMERLELEMTPRALENHIVDQMVALYRKKIPYHPGAVEAVALAAAHHTTGLASGSPHSLVAAVTGDAALRGKFKAIVSGNQTTHGKPDPEIYLTITAQLGVAPANCICLEDSANGILAGKSAGMKVIAVPDPRFMPPADKLGRADVVLKSLVEFSLATLEQLDNL